MQASFCWLHAADTYERVQQRCECTTTFIRAVYKKTLPTINRFGKLVAHSICLSAVTELWFIVKLKWSHLTRSVQIFESFSNSICYSIWFTLLVFKLYSKWLIKGQNMQRFVTSGPFLHDTHLLLLTFVYCVETSTCVQLALAHCSKASTHIQQWN